MHEYKKLGDLDDADALPELVKMTQQYIAAQDQDISECAAALMDGLHSKL